MSPGIDWAEVAKYALGGLGGPQEQQQQQMDVRSLVPPQSMTTQPPQQTQGMPKSRFVLPGAQGAAMRMLQVPEREETAVGGPLGTALGAVAGAFIPGVGPGLGAMAGGALGGLAD